MSSRIKWPQVTNNWWPDEVMGEPLYEDGLPANDLWANSLQALYEFNPLEKDELLYRKQKFGVSSYRYAHMMCAKF